MGQLATLLTIPRRLAPRRVPVEPQDKNQKDPVDDHRGRLSKSVGRLGDERHHGCERHGDRMFPR